MEEFMQSIQFVGNVQIDVIILTALGTYFIIKALKKKHPKFPFRQAVPSLLAGLLITLKAFTVTKTMGLFLVWDAIVNGFLATAGYVKIISLIKDRGLLAEDKVKDADDN